MGGNNSHSFDEKLFNSQWTRTQGSLQGRAVWRNKTQPQRQIQQFPIYANTQDDIQRQSRLFDLRKNSSQLVAATHFKQTVKGGLCSNAAQGRLFLERIPLKLQALRDIPFPDILHLHFNALTGYRKLFKLAGPFRPQQQQIGFNTAGQVKVWLNGDYSASRPSTFETSEVSMVRNLLQLIQDNTDHKTMPRDNPSVLNFIYRNNNDVTFDQALISVRQYSNQYNSGIIPKNLGCIQRVGVQHIRNSLLGQRTGTGLNTFNVQQPVNTVQTSFVQSRPVMISNNQPLSTVVAPLRTNVLTNQRSSLNTFNVHPLVNTVQKSLMQSRPVMISNNQPLSTVVAPLRTQTTVQSVQPIQLTQNVQPVHTVQQRFSGIQTRQTVQTSGVQSSKINFNISNVQANIVSQQGFLESQVQTVRQAQTLRPVQHGVQVSLPQEQRVIQQIIRQPQQGVQIVNHQIQSQLVQATTLNQGLRVQQVVSNIPVLNQTSIPNQTNVYTQNVVSVTQNQVQNQNNFVRTVQSENQIAQQTSNFTKQSTQLVERQANQSRNMLESNTTSVGIGNIGSQFQTYTGNNQFSESKTFQTKNLTNFDATSSRYKDVSLEDGKSSEALLAELRNISTGTRQISTGDNQFQLNKYAKVDSYGTSKLDFGSYGTTKVDTYEAGRIDTYGAGNQSFGVRNTQSYGAESLNSYEDNDNYQTFKKYAINQNLEDNLQMKYSMTQDLYDHSPAQQHSQYDYDENNYQYQNQNNQYRHEQYEQHQGEYHVDYDPEILADIQRMKN